jgi:hypothetical protein
MTIDDSDILFKAGGSCWTKSGTLTRRTAPVNRGGEEGQEVFTRAAPNAYQFDRGGLIRPAGTDVPRVTFIDPLSSGTPDPYWLLEDTRKNIASYNRDLTQAVWTKTNVTAVKDQTGIDGVASSASRITATAGNGTCLQAALLASSARYQSAWVKRLVGSGTINMTTDNGATWTAIVPTTSWTRLTIPTQTLANPTFGFRIVTNGDSIAVDFVQNEPGMFPTSEIPTTTLDVTRARDASVFSYYAAANQAITLYARFVERGSVLDPTDRWVLQLSASAPRLILRQPAGTGLYRMSHINAAAAEVFSAAATAPTYGQLCELRGVLLSTGSVQLNQSINLGTEVASAASGTQTLPSAWGGSGLYINEDNGTCVGYNAFDTIAVVRGAPSLTDLRALRTA